MEQLWKKFFRQTVDKLVYRFNIESGVEVGDGSTTPMMVFRFSPVYWKCHLSGSHD